MIQAVGGYWSPQSGVVRLLEEIGELSQELTPDDHFASPGVGAELADLWIISTCTANQFNVPLRERVAAAPNKERARSAGIRETLLDALRWAGYIGRIVNYYDGPKTPRSIDGWVPLRTAVPNFHKALYRLAEQCGVSLNDEVDAKLELTAKRDQDRFATGYDPSTADSIDRFAGLQATTSCLFAAKARLWGAPEWSRHLTLEQNTAVLAPYLTRFAKAAPHEKLDGFVVSVPAAAVHGKNGEGFSPMTVLARWFQHFLTALAQADPLPNTTFDGDVDRRGWQFTFHDQRMFVSVFSPLYGKNHPRHSESEIFIMFQPEESFTNHGVGGGSSTSVQTKQRIRDAFTEAGRSYDTELVDRRIEAQLYLLERFPGDHEAHWWEWHAGDGQ